MSIGDNILALRSAMNLSQGDLADMLGVSRQSVSKWETDAAVPDLDKLMKLCDVFDVSLDELVGRQTANAHVTPPTVTTAETRHTAEPQKIIGYILLTVSLLAGVLVAILAEHEDETFISLTFILTTLVCSVICLFAKHHAGYWCAWAIAAPFVLLSPNIVGMPILRTANILLFIFAVTMVLIANRLFSQTAIQTSRKQNIRILSLWGILIGVRTAEFLYMIHATIGTASAWLFLLFIDLLSYIAVSVLLTYTVCYMKSLRKP